MCLALTGAAPVAAQEPVTPDSIVIGRWSVLVGTYVFDLAIEPDHQYRLWQPTEAGDTVVLSMGRWDRFADRFCLTPGGRTPSCGPLDLEERGQLGTEWRFETPGNQASSWLAYRLGLAPWDTVAALGRTTEIYQPGELAARPRLLGCPVQLELPPDTRGPTSIRVRFVVEPDSTVSDVEILDPPSHALAQAALGTARSCRAVPGRLLNQRPVRVQVEMVIPFPHQRPPTTPSPAN